MICLEKLKTITKEGDKDMFEEYRGYLISQDTFGYYEVWNKRGDWLKLKIEGKQKAIEFIDHIISAQED